MVGTGKLWMAMMGGFLVLWGGWEMAEQLGLVADARFPWPLFLVGVGLAMALSAARGRGWQGCCGEAPGPQRP